MMIPGTKSTRVTKGGFPYSVADFECRSCGRVKTTHYRNRKNEYRCLSCSRKGSTPSNFQIKCIVNCMNCSKIIPTGKTKRDLEIRPLHFCNSSCQNHWQNRTTDFNKGPNNPAFVHGERVNGQTPNYGPAFDTKLKRLIRTRDGFNCQRCGLNFSGKLSKKLDVHHIDQNKFNNDPGNLTSLCKSCHLKIHWELRK